MRQKSIRRTITSIVMGLAASSMTAGLVVAQDVTVRFATLQSPRHELSVEMQKAFDRIAEETDGRVEFQVHYGSESGFSAKQYVSALEQGMFDGALIATSASALEYPWLGVYGLPFLAPDEAARQDMLAATEPMLETFSKEHRIVPLAYPLHPDRWLVIYSSRDIETVEDFEGMLIRTYDPNTNTIAASLGAVPTSLQKSEIYMGLQRGTVDGAITGITAAEEMKFDEVVEHIFQLDVMFLPHILGLSEKVWAQLGSEDQETVRRVFDEWEEDFVAKHADSGRAEDPYAYAKSKGMNIIVPEESIEAVFEEIHKNAVDEFIAKDEASAKAYEAIIEARESHLN